MKKSTMIRIEAELVTPVKIHASLRGITSCKYVSEAVREKLEQESKLKSFQDGLKQL